MPDRKPQHASSETDLPDRRPQNATSETNMPAWRPIGDLDMLHRGPTCLIGDPSETSTCFIGDPFETDMLQYIITIYINKQKICKNKNISKNIR